MKRLAQAVGALGLVILVLQLVPGGPVNQAGGPGFVAAPEVASLVRGACYDCHSDEARWDWQGRVAPFSWIVAARLERARGQVNFSQWNGRAPEAVEASLQAVARIAQSDDHYGIALAPAGRAMLTCWAERGTTVAGRCLPGRLSATEIATIVHDALCVVSRFGDCQPVLFTPAEAAAVAPPLETARRLLEHAAKAAPSNRIIQNNLGVMLALQGDLPAAVQRFEAALDPNGLVPAVADHVGVGILSVQGGAQLYALYYPQIEAEGVPAIASDLAPGERRALLAGDNWYIVRNVRPKFALRRDAGAADPRFAEAWRMGFGFVQEAGGLVIVERPRARPLTTGRERWYPEANLSIVLRALDETR